MTKIKSTFLLLSACVLLTISCEQDNFIDPNDERYGPVSSEEGIVLDLNTTYQTIHHFGASGGFQEQWIGNWPDTSREPLAELLFSSEMDQNGNPKGIALSHWRVIIGDGAADQDNSGFKPSSWFRETECFLNPDGTYNWTKQAGSQWFMNKAQQYGVPSFTAWATSPPYFMTQNGFTFRTSGVSGFNCPEENYDDYASFLTEVVKFYEDQGFNIESVCPFNETQYAWQADIGDANQSGTFASNTHVAQVVRIMDQLFTENNVNAKIMIPEAGQLQYLYQGGSSTENQIFDFFSSSSSNYLGDLSNISNHIAGHSYFTNNSAAQTISQREALRASINSFAGLDYWQTEYSLLGTAYQQGQDVATLQEMDYALWLARIIHADLDAGNATGWDFWTVFNQSTFGDHPFRFNLILYQPNANSPTHTDGTYQVVKNLWALGNYSRFVRPGMIRFEVRDTDYNSKEEALDNFAVSGFWNEIENEIVLVCVNRTAAARPLNLVGYGDTFSVEGDTFDLYTTSSSQNLEHSTQAVDDLVIPAKSVVTLKASLN